MATKTKLIHGHAFEISQPYEAGHAITEAEARALNQVRSENIGNNVREKVKELLDAGNAADAEKLVAEKDAEYVFSFSTGGGAVKRDPIETEARKLARELLKTSLAESGRKLTVAPEGETEESWKEKVESEIDRIAAIDEVLKVAKKNVAERQKRGESLLAAVGGVSV